MPNCGLYASQYRVVSRRLCNYSTNEYRYAIMLRYLFVCLFGFLTFSSTTRLYRGRAPGQECLTILRAATHETELGDHDFCLSRSHYTDTDPTCRERAATAGIEPGTSSPGVARSTAELPRVTTPTYRRVGENSPLETQCRAIMITR